MYNSQTQLRDVIYYKSLTVFRVFVVITIHHFSPHMQKRETSEFQFEKRNLWPNKTTSKTEKKEEAMAQVLLMTAQQSVTVIL